ncbi:DUF2334 domain-containing protein [Methylomusa anaerophila]|uniref:DUF2334 domain-containing protein n=1 Tax=Methylomusa anaerophila TaxID=1930071 RepID=A0A348AR24_9FIRM|nr:DUF2334 domain-containing protein [Methylomusa anaerophila]BBB93522.1 hypothetical protein MAMMFC1_04239 [Methylomusa anaerophila]
MIEVRKKAIMFFLLAIFTFGICLPTSSYSSAPKLKTYIVYDSPNRFADSFPLVNALIEHLGHFDLACQPMALQEWKPGALQDAELIVYAGLSDVTLPQGLLQEMAHARRVIWFEKNIEQMAAYLHWQDFKLEGVFNGWSFINYKRDVFIDDWINVVIAQPGQNAQVFATVKDIVASKPLAWQRDNVYYCGLLEVHPKYMITLSGLLHQFIPNQNHNHSHSHKALLRIEDVSPLVNSEAVGAVIATITKYNIPFSIGVIPVGVTKDDRYIFLHERPNLLKVLKEAQDNGASIIMHGYTHQNKYSPKTGEGYEFWNARDDKPMENDDAFTSERIEAGIEELVRCGLTPVAFEPPHYAMSEAGYKVLSRYFNIFSGQIQISDKSDRLSLSLPYVTTSTYLNGMMVIPENMGYYDGKTFLVDHMLQSSEQILEIQDGFACFFYHGYLPPDKLPSIIEGLQKQGYEFYDLRQLPILVHSPKIKIIGRDGQLRVEVDAKLQSSWGSNPVDDNMFKKIGSVHITLLLLILGIFVVIIIRLRANANKHYE